MSIQGIHKVIRGLLILLMISFSSTSFSYDVIRSKQMMDEAAKKGNTQSTTTKTQSVKPETEKSSACTCSAGVMIDAKNPDSGYIYHCQCGKLECVVTQSKMEHTKGKPSNPPLFCK